MPLISWRLGSWRMAGSEVGVVEDWDEIDGFWSPGEYRRFLRWVAEAIDEGALFEMPVQVPTPGIGESTGERWFRARSGRIWSIIPPDPPFTGMFFSVPRFRIMEPVVTGKYRYPKGFVVYMNSSGQTISTTGDYISARADHTALVRLT